MSRTLGMIAAFGLGTGVVSLVLAYALGGRDFQRMLHSGLSIAQSCRDDGLTRTGDAPTERRLPWAGGDSVDIALPATVRLRGGEGSDVIVRGSPDAIAHVEVRDGRITLDCRWVAGARRIEIILPGRAFRHVGLSGSAKVALENLNQPELALRISGSGTVTGQGAIDRLTIGVAGSGNALLAEVTVKNLKVRISGSGSVEAAPKDDADIDISGSGSVRLASRPVRLTQHIAGSGRISQPAIEAAEGKK
jgi:hypothetical protein